MPAVLSGDEARHASGVARLKAGEAIMVGDGRGTIGRGIAVAVGAGEVVVELQDVNTVPAPSPEIWLVQALAKGDRDELAIQACTELGVDRIIPWQAGRSVSVWKADKATKGQTRWNKIVTEASKQSLRARVPQVSALSTTSDIAQLGEENQLVLLEAQGSDPLSAYIPPKHKNLVLIVGPEGGIEPAEREVLLDAGAVDLRLGNTVLRTSTAGVAALSVMNSAMGRW
jgi:16S rRNA (uracil1498-N3)-methyltransferase